MWILIVELSFEEDNRQGQAEATKPAIIADF